MPRFLQRPFPSANAVILEGMVVDPGVDPGDDPVLVGPLPAWTVTTHWHSDHAGAVHALQARGVRVAASAAEADRLDAGDPDAGRAHWLHQRFTPYRVDRRLAPGDVVQAGREAWTVLALPGHTPEQIGLHHPASATLIAGDALHASDIGWLDLDADPAALDHATATLDSIDRLRPRLVLPGHGPAITDVADALARGRRRLATWRADPAAIVFHAAKRILTHALMTEGGIREPDLPPTLLGCPWFTAHASRLGLTAADFVPVLVAEMLRSGAAVWNNGVMSAAGPYRGKGARDQPSPSPPSRR